MSLSSRLKRGIGGFVGGFVEGFVFGVRSVEEQNVEHETNKPTEDTSKDDEIAALKEEIERYKKKASYGTNAKTALDSAIQELNKTKTFSIKTVDSVAEGAAAADTFFEVVRTVVTEVLGYEKFDDHFAYALKILLDFAKEREPNGEPTLSEEEMKEVVSELVLVADPNFHKPRHKFEPSITQNLTEEDKAEYNRLLTEKRVAAENVKILEDAIKDSENTDAEKLEQAALRDKAIEDLRSLEKIKNTFLQKGIILPKGNGPIFKDYNLELKAMLDNGAPQEEVSALQEFIEDGVEKSMPGKVAQPVPVPEGFVKESPPAQDQFFTEEEKQLLSAKFHEVIEDVKALVEKERLRKQNKIANRRAKYNEVIRRFKNQRKALSVKLNDL